MNDWYYWSKNRHAHYTIWYNRDDTVARATIRPEDDLFRWEVHGPCWSLYEETGTAQSLEEAKHAVDERIMAIIREEFEPEYIAPLG